MESKDKIKKIAEAIELMMDIPCFSSECLAKCGIGQEYNPINCKEFNTWMKANIKEESDNA